VDVILLSDVEKVGLRGEVVHVANGYARNFLLPRRLAERATPAKVAELQRREAAKARHEARSVEQAQQIAELLSKTVLRFEVKAGPTGALFGSVTPTDIADEIWRTRKVRVDRRKIGLDTIKRIGRYEVPIEVFQDVDVAVKTLVVPEGGELPPEEELEAMAAAEAAEAAAAAQPTAETALIDLDAAEDVPDDAFDRAAETATATAADAAATADTVEATEPAGAEPAETEASSETAEANEARGTT
jgi:large subunit ribosomal protein L9